MTARLNIIIVNFRTPGLAIDCLASLEPEVAANPGTKVWMVENGSGDDSAARIGAAIAERGWAPWATLLVQKKNHGFAGGNNRGLEASGIGDYTLLLNSDTVVHAGCLRTCLEMMEREPLVGVMSCKLLNADGSIQNVARPLPNPIRAAVWSLGLPYHLPRVFGWADTEDLTWDRAREARDVGWLGGAFLLIRREVVEKVGLLDERFFFYGEDIEFGHRVWKAGYRCRYDPEASITHLGGASSDPERMAAQARSVHVWRARYLNQRLCYGRLAEWFVRGVDIFAIGMRLLAAKARGRGGEAKAVNWAASLRVITRRLC